MKNYTSSVPPERSIEEIEKLLVKAGARSISKEYSADGKVAALNFVILNPETNVFQVLKKSRSRHATFRRGWEQKLREQAARTAWRLMLDWCAVQLSLIEMKQAETLQVFMPYIWTGRTTFYAALKENKFAALTYTGDKTGGDDET